MRSGSDVHAVIGQGYEACPSCSCENWKSAKMVVLEGTTFTTGEIKGNITDPGKSSGGIRNFLVSDRWFSWDERLEADVDLTTTSGLVLAVKKLMVEYGSLVRLPPAPTRETPPLAPSGPPKIGFFERVRPIRPTEPTEPEWDEPPVERPWYSWFWHYLRIFVALFGIPFAIHYYLSSGDTTYNPKVAVGWYVALVMSWTLLKAFTANRNRREGHERLQGWLLKKHQKVIKKYENNLAKFELDRDKATAQEQAHEEAVSLYEQEMTSYRKQLGSYEQQFAQRLASYEAERHRVLVARELIWERARVCLRCGTAYQGKI